MIEFAYEMYSIVACKGSPIIQLKILAYTSNQIEVERANLFGIIVERNVKILEGAEVDIGFYDRVGRDQPRGYPEGACYESE